MKPVLREPDATFENEEEYDPEKDLFAKYELLPLEVQEVLNLFEEMDNTYEECRKLEDALKPLGYTFDWYLDAQPYNLRKVESARPVSRSIFSRIGQMFKKLFN